MDLLEVVAAEFAFQANEFREDRARFSATPDLYSYRIQAF